MISQAALGFLLLTLLPAQGDAFHRRGAMQVSPQGLAEVRSQRHEVLDSGVLYEHGVCRSGHFLLLFSGFHGDLFTMLRLNKPPSPALLLAPTLSLYVNIYKDNF